MSGEQKKVSLFKQKINHARAKTDTKDNGFPQAPCIIEKLDQADMMAVEQRQNEKAKPKSFLNSLQESNIIGTEQKAKMQTENWQKVNNMSQEERQAAIASLRASLPGVFLKKFDKSKVVPPQETDTASIPKGKATVTQKPVEQKEQQQSPQPSWRSLLKLNIETNLFQLTESDNECLIDLARLTELIGSQNNQSQVVGGSVLEKWSKIISSAMTSKTRELIVINQVPFHGGIVGEELTKIIKLGMKQLSQTTYRSVFLELCASLMSTFKHIGPLFKTETRKQFVQQLEVVAEKIKHFDIPKSDAMNIRQSVGSVIVFLKQLEDEEEINWHDCINSVDAILQLSLLEESIEEGYWKRALQTVEKCSDFDNLLTLLRFQYELINKMIIKRNKQPFINIQHQRNLWTPSIELLIIKFSKALWSIGPEQVLCAIFLGRFVGGTSWEIVSDLSKIQGEKGLLMSGMLLFNTLPDLKASTISQQQINALNVVLEWFTSYIGKKESKINLNYLLATYLELFLQEEEYYSQLKQANVENLLVKLTRDPQVSLDSITSVEQVKTLSKNYNYSSFGNMAFSYLLLSIAAACSFEKEAIVLRETILPCWRQFIATVKHMQGCPKTRVARGNRELKDQIIDRIKGELNEEDHNNYLMNYLSL